MRKVWISALALALLSTFVALPAGARPLLGCSNPTHLTGYHGTLSYGNGVYVQQDVWTEQGTQTMDVCGPSDWVATVNETGQPASGVKTYPDSDVTYTDWLTCSPVTVDSLTKLQGTFSEVVPAGQSWDSAWDLFLGGTVHGHDCGPFHEVMVIDESHNVDFPTPQRSVTFQNGTAYNVWTSADGQLVQYYRQTPIASGSVGLLSVLRDLETNGLLTGAEPIQFVQKGFEVLTTHGNDTQFALNGWSVTKEP